MGFKYLKAAQQLLDEVASVGKDFKTNSNNGFKLQLKGNKDSPVAETSSGGEINGKRAVELMTAERQELQMKKAKLISMLDEKSFERLKPDMLIVLGDVSAKGSELTDSKWLSVLQQFQRIMGPFLGLPLHIVLGNRDVGECCKLNAKSVGQIASSLPGLDSGGCGVFEISNVSFVSLNAVALLCGNNDLHFSMEKIIERESRSKKPCERHQGSSE